MITQDVFCQYTDYYKILGVTKGATDNDIKNMSAMIDRAKDSVSAEAMMKMNISDLSPITSAAVVFEILSSNPLFDVINSGLIFQYSLHNSFNNSTDVLD